MADAGGFRLAADQLGVSPTQVTRAIITLEKRLEMRLLNRTTRSMSVTDEGVDYLDSCREIIAKVDEIESRMGEMTRQPYGMLRVACAGSFAGAEFARLIAGYRLRQPRVELDVTAFDLCVDMAAESFDVCFVDSRGPAPSTMVRRPLTHFGEILVASERYLSQHGEPHAPTDLTRHRLLTFAGRDHPTWEISDAAATHRIATNGVFRTTSEAMLRAAALNHMGIILVSQSMVDDDIDSGSLKRVLPDCTIDGGSYEIAILYAGRSHLPARTRSFVDFVVQHYRPADAIPLSRFPA